MKLYALLQLKLTIGITTKFQMYYRKKRNQKQIEKCRKQYNTPTGENKLKIN